MADPEKEKISRILKSAIENEDILNMNSKRGG